MLTKIKIPVINTDSIDINIKPEEIHFAGENFTGSVEDIDRQYQQMLKENYVDTEVKKGKDVDNSYEYSETDVLVMDSYKNDVTPDFIYDMEERGRMFITILNINPIYLTPEAEDELRSWVNESNMILNNERLDNTEKIKALPQMNFILKVENKEYEIQNCKLFENYSENKFPFYFAIIVEKINLL